MKCCIEGLGFILGFKVACGLRGQGVGIRDEGSGFRVGIRVQVQGLGFRVGIRVQVQDRGWSVSWAC